MPRSRAFAQVDVFGSRPYAGNPLAVVLDAEGLDDAADILGAEGLVEMLRRQDDRADRRRGAVLVMDRHLRLRIGAELAGLPLACLASLRQALEDLVRIIDRRRHQLGGLPAGITEHDALVAGAFAGLVARVHALGDIGGLRMQQNVDLDLLPVEAVLLVADRLDCAARRGPHLGADLPLVERASHLTGDDDPIGGCKCLAGDADLAGVHADLLCLAVEQVHDLVGYAVANLVWMAFRHTLGREEELVALHECQTLPPKRNDAAQGPWTASGTG